MNTEKQYSSSLQREKYGYFEFANVILNNIRIRFYRNSKKNIVKKKNGDDDIEERKQRLIYFKEKIIRLQEDEDKDKDKDKSIKLSYIKKI